MATIARPVAATLGLAWLGSFLPAYWPRMSLAHWPAEWARHVGGGWPGTVPVVQYALGWVVAGALLRALPGAAHAWRTLALAVAAVLALRFTWLASYAGNGELIGAALALALWPAAERLPGAWLERLLAVGVAAFVLYAALGPRATGHAGIHWVPFTDLARPGGLGLDVGTLCRKLFWFGSPVWLLAAAGLAPAWAGLGVGATLFGLEALRVASAPGVQYATTTDAACALAVGLATALLARGSAPR